MQEGREHKPRADKGSTAVNIKCPFFRRHSNVEIRCEGVMERTSCAILFERVQDKRMYQRSYCETRFDCCEHYRALMAGKYAEE